MSASDRLDLQREKSNRQNLSNRLPDSPAQTIPFGIYGDDVSFSPLYYPSRMSITTEKDLEKTGAGCEGQKIRVEELKNSTLHISGKIHSSDMWELNQLSHTSNPVDVLTPILEGGGMAFYVESAERGELIGYDNFPTAEEYMFKYTLDLVSTGEDEYESTNYSRFVP